MAGEKVVVELAGKNDRDRGGRSRSRSRGRDSYWRDQDRNHDRPSYRSSGGGGYRGGGGGGGRPHRTQWALSVDNLSSRCR